MISVAQLLEKKGNEVWTIMQEASVISCIKSMDERNIGALPVVDDDNNLVGIISERDISRKMILCGKSPQQCQVHEIMTKNVVHTFTDQAIDECLVLMNENHVRHLPVVESDKLAGMVSIGDVVKEIIEDQKYTIRSLQTNISWAESY